MHLTLAGVSLWRRQMSDCGNKRAPLEYVIFFFLKRGRRQEYPKHGQETQHLIPYSQGIMVTCLTWDITFRRELCAASSRRRYEKAIPTPPCWGMCVRIAGFLSHRLKEHHLCQNLPTGKLKACHHKLAHQSMALRVEVSGQRLPRLRGDLSTLDATNS